MITDPVVGELFFERSDALNLLRARVGKLKEGFRNNVAITGQRLSGKTSLLHQFLYTLEDPAILPVYIEVVTEPFRDFARRFTGNLIHGYIEKKGGCPGDNFEALMAEARNVIPATAAAADSVFELVEKEEFEQAYDAMLGLTSAIKEETGVLCVVIMDEFHNLSGLDIRNPFKIFGKKMMIQKDTMYVVSSSQINALKTILTEKLSLLFGNFQTIELAGFDQEAAMSFLRRKMEPFVIGEDYAKFLVAFLSGFPFHLDVVCRRMKEFALIFNQKEIGEEIILKSFDSLLFDPTGALSQCYMSGVGYLLEDPDYSSYGNILIAMANGNYTLKSITKWIGRNRDLSKQLGRLVDLNVIFKNGNFYYFYDSLLGFWVKNVYCFRKNSFLSFSVDKSQKIREILAARMREFADESKKSLESRISRLILLFNNETVKIGSKRRRLVRFCDCCADSSTSGNPFIISHAKGGSWIWRAHENYISENDIAEFVKYCKASKKKILRKIIVAAGGISTNAKILAKESRIWLWDLKGLNFVMDVFGKPRVVLHTDPAELRESEFLSIDSETIP
jgi:AAA+ ATPase superfamily predicted ATPase